MENKFYCICLMLYILGGLPNGFSQVIFEDDFESGGLKTEWTAIPGEDNAVVGIENQIQGRNVFYQGSNGLAMGKTSSKGGLVTNRLDLKLDLSTYSQVEMDFYLNNYFDETHPQDGIYISDDDGATFTKVMDFDGDNWQGDVYSKVPPLDIDRLASHYGLTLSTTFIIRFQQYDDSYFGAYSSSSRDGIFIDDVEVRVPDQTYISTFPYSTGFEGSVELPAGWKQANPTFPYINSVEANSTGLVSGASTVRLEGIAAVGSTISARNASREGSNGLILGKRVGGELGAVAVDLHLDLSSTPDIELSFWMNNYFENTHPLDGIFFSDDAGVTFTKVMDFDGDNWASASWSQLPPLDIDRLASHYGLTLSSSFIVRFQQYDNSYFGAYSSSSRDGIFIDDVEVREPDQTYISTFPYSTGFEDGSKLPSGWKQANPSFPYINPVEANSTGLVNGVSTVRLEGIAAVGSTISARNASREGSNGLILGKRVGGVLGAVAVDLHLDLSNTPDIELSFWMNNYFENTHPIDGIFFSDDAGVTFTKVMDFAGDKWASASWSQLPPLDIDRLASHYGLTLSSSFIVRFQQYDNSYFGAYSSSSRDGIFIDDVEVRVPDQTYISTFPYSTGFEDGSKLPSGWKQANPSFPYINPVEANSTGLVNGVSTVRLEGVAAVGSTISTRNASREGSNGLILGKRVGGELGAVAVDLHLDLSNTPDIELSFWMNNYFENTHPIDGIFFSDDAGVTFTKVMDFDGDKWANASWGQLPPLDIDRLASHYGLTLSSTFIVRFQQYDNSYFGAYSSSSRDGIFIDDVEVRVPDQTFINKFPYNEGFEEGTKMPKGWAYSNSTFPYVDPTSDNSTGIIDNKSTVRLEGAVGVTDKYQSLTVSNSGSNGLYLGKNASGEFGVVSADLKLNLKDAQNVILKFDIFSSYEELSAHNGIYLSVNEGLTFTKIQDFTLNSNKWESMEVDISTLADENKLVLSEKTVVRFQQYGRFAIYTGSSSRDGIFLDDVEITTKSRINHVISFSSLPDMQFGDAPFDLVATADSELPVQFTVVSGPATITGKQLTITGAGTVTVKAELPGDNEYQAAEAIEQSFEVEKADQEITFGSISAKTYGDAPFTVVATADSKLPVTISLVSGPGTISGSKVTITGAGTITVKATQAGNDNYNATSEEKEITVEKAGQTITFANLPDKTYGDQPVNLSASSSSGLPVTLKVKSGPGKISGTKLTIEGAGAIVVTASQPGNKNYKAASEVNRTQTVKKKSQTLDFTAIEDKAYGAASFDLIASSSANLEPSFTVLSGPATISGKTVSLTGAGKVVIEASQSGNDNYAAAEKKTNSFCVAPPVPEIEIIGSEFSPELVLKVTNAPEGSTYQWKLDGSDISGADQDEINLSEGGAYSVMVTVDGCSSISEPQTLTDLEERPGATGLVNLFPNPAKNTFSITGLTIGEAYELTINDLNGRSRVVLDYVHTENSFINISDFNAGVYLIEVQGYRLFVVRKLIIKD
ncbi:T9SS type A sorting domain-containing protein [Cyclobacterium sp. 1_MG-2023]|uniref:T9SS type A sorting domain-containing protein n=1 Tax=Cyclobacterium sp. 1_MG-2023 TaxID=3062681 RepID=UPI0026E169D3|nr:T9SS type A sorting domain-containing protein [Cyclobacterium sp. 1_MG-2023]MDO6437172.1 T9SS type A sorting domain-containing protein [Cyclobacterium sp. 1_MG-2023]